MLKTGKIIFLAFSLLLFTSAYASGITESDVKNLISKVGHAVEKKDAQSLASAMSDNVEIVINLKVQGKKQVIKATKHEYLEMLKQSWAMSSNYKYSKSNLVIEIQGDKAFVSATVNESMTVQGQNISATSKEEVLIEKDNGNLLITKVIGYTKM